MQSLRSRLEALEQQVGDPKHFVYYPVYHTGDPRYVLPGGIETDSDTFTQAVERAGQRAVVIKVEYVKGGRNEF